MKRSFSIFIVLAVLAASGCDAPPPTDCVTGTIVDCMCTDEGLVRSGVSECQATGQFGPCACMGMGVEPDSGATNRPEPDSGVAAGPDRVSPDTGETMTSTQADAGLVDTGMTMTSTDADAGIPDIGSMDAGTGTSTASDAAITDTGTSTLADAG